MHGLSRNASDYLNTPGCPPAGYKPPFDATAVAKLRKAGAVIIGKTNMDAFGMGSSTEYSDYQVTQCEHQASRSCRTEQQLCSETRELLVVAALCGLLLCSKLPRLQITCNPHDPTRVPGGSSGGSAAAVAAAQCVAALGSDTGMLIGLLSCFCM